MDDETLLVTVAELVNEFHTCDQESYDSFESATYLSDGFRTLLATIEDELNQRGIYV